MSLGILVRPTDCDSDHTCRVGRGIRALLRVLVRRDLLENMDATKRNRSARLTELVVDDGPHNSDGLLLHAWDGSERVRAFISRRVMDDWVDPKQPYGRRKSLFRAQYNALGKRNLAAIERIVASKYQRGAAFNRQHPFVDVLFSDITESGEVLDLSELEQKGETASLSV
jgi:hypothetical protein